MARRYRRRHRYTVARPLKTTKYSNETYASSVLLTSSNPGQHGIASLSIIPDVIGGVLGTRKCKNFTLRIYAHETTSLLSGNSTHLRSSVAFALVFIPEGTEASVIQFGSDSAKSLYEPNQNVILSGLLDSSQVYTFKTRLARNLNAGDKIALVCYDLYVPQEGATTTTLLAFSCNYAISF